MELPKRGVRERSEQRPPPFLWPLQHRALDDSKHGDLFDPVHEEAVEALASARGRRRPAGPPRTIRGVAPEPDADVLARHRCIHRERVVSAAVLAWGDNFRSARGAKGR